MPPVPPEVITALGLTLAEAKEVERLLGRAPNQLELALFAVMWSEHCSYKSSAVHLRRLPSEAPWVLVGPGENAGVVDLGDGIAAALRIESHNHPSAVEPVQGAATGVGGIIRDIFTMGARPVALMDPLRFGPLDDPRSRWIAEGVIRGISSYGNAVGVPTVGGEVVFDETYAGNPLVNVLCLGVLPVGRLALGRASGLGNLAVLLGSATGRDGIGGVSVLASAGFGDAEADAEKRPSVQVGDPFEEKRLIEACLALFDAGLVVGIQDLGGAGLACATSETASRAGTGMDVDVAAVPRREPGMAPSEVMTSESQERMLAIVEPGDLDEVLAVCERWEVRAAVVGRVTEGGRLRILDGEDVVADVPASVLHDAAPRYDRPRKRPDRSREIDPDSLPNPSELGTFIFDVLAERRYVWEQYDHMLFLNTVEGPGGDASVLRLKHPTTGLDTGRGLALTTDGNHRWCAVDPRRGAAMVVAEAVLNLACVGARPLALVDCLNLGNPEHPEVMWQLSEVVDGLADACRAFGLPIVGGNVSLYNESAGRDIDPTPIVGALGVVDRLDRRPPGPRLVEGGLIVQLGPPPGYSPLGGSLWAWAQGARGGKLPPLDLDLHRRVAEVVRDAVAGGGVWGVHDVSEGGLALALAEMAVASGVGFQVHAGGGLRHEAPSRVVACVDPDLVDHLDRLGVPVTAIGGAGGDRLVVDHRLDLSLEVATEAWRDALPSAFR